YEQVLRQGAQHMLRSRQQRQRPKNPREEKARQRSGDRDVELLNRFHRLAPEARNSSPKKKSDGVDGEPVGKSHDTVGQLMEHHRSKEKETGHHPHAPLFGWQPLGMELSELHRAQIDD